MNTIYACTYVATMCLEAYAKESVNIFSDSEVGRFSSPYNCVGVYMLQVGVCHCGLRHWLWCLL